MRVLGTAASKHGATGEIADATGKVFAEHGFDTEVIPPAEVGSVADYDAVVLGSAVYMGHWLEPAKALVRRSRDTLAARPVWLFSSGPVGDPSRRLVQQIRADPVDLGEIVDATRARDHRMFTGKLDRRNLRLPQRAALTVVRGLEGDFCDWIEIEQWAAGIAEALHRGSRLPRAS
jgi:menaquinone-dependent protoporphyrinogen oxidase